MDYKQATNIIENHARVLPNAVTSGLASTANPLRHQTNYPSPPTDPVLLPVPPDETPCKVKEVFLKIPKRNGG